MVIIISIHSYWRLRVVPKWTNLCLFLEVLWLRASEWQLHCDSSVCRKCYRGW
uniref:LRR-RLK n=1 Tax=Rhizophora mucronata TaxID=61149 RepID=A0A2P2MEK2_RHIMU